MTFLIPFCLSGLGLDEQIFQEDFMKNGICFLGLPHPRPAPKAGVCGKQSRSDCAANSYGKRYALATPSANPRNNGLTLPEPSCYDVKAVRDSPSSAPFSLLGKTPNRGLFKRLYATPLGVGFQ